GLSNEEPVQSESSLLAAVQAELKSPLSTPQTWFRRTSMIYKSGRERQVEYLSNSVDWFRALLGRPNLPCRCLTEVVEEDLEVGAEEVGGLQAGEVTAAGEFCPVDDVVGPFGEMAYGHGDVGQEGRQAGGGGGARWRRRSPNAHGRFRSRAGPRT